MGSGYKTLKEVNIGVYYLHNNNRSVFTQMLIDNKFDSKVRAPNLRLAMENIRKAGFNLQADLDSDEDIISVHGLIGCDVIELLQPIKL